jgi:15-cis-phytoene synthase
VNSELENSTSTDYCISKAIPDGSNLYYATLYETAENKKIIITLHAFLNELSEIIYECSDPGVAKIKLNWWNEELVRLTNNQARHPVTKQILECINVNDDFNSSLNSIIDFFNHFIFIDQTDSLETILSLYKSTTGEIWSLCAQQLGIDNKQTLDVIRDMGATIHYINCLQLPYTYINESRCIIPSNIISQTDLLNFPTEPEKRQEIQKGSFTPLLLELQNKINKTHQEIKTIKPVTKNHLILNRLACKTCEEILRDDCCLLDKNINLTPIRKLWIAWQTKTFG